MTTKDIHLVGSIPMDTGESVMRKAASTFGGHICRIPDGETGERARWVYWQRTMLENHPDMEIDTDIDKLRLTEWDGTLLRETDLMRFRNGVDPTKVVFDTGYDKAAIESWETFERLQNDGTIAPDVRFMVALPTPMSSAFMYVSPNAYADYIPAYERALKVAVDNILKAIPAEKLSIQWDICQEVLVMEDYFPTRPDNYKEQIFELMGRLGAIVPEPVELGYHLCYGTPRDKHLVMPKDMSILVELAHAILDGVPRTVNFIHMPVPKDRDDAAYFAPLARLNLPDATRLYLGIIHFNDRNGDKKRIAAAEAAGAEFGLSTECGWGRADPERLPDLLQAHVDALSY